MEHVDIPNIPLAIAVAVVVLSCIYYFVKNRNVLPGPSGIPFLGLFFSLTDENIHTKLLEYKKEYGDLFSFTYAGRLFINLGSVKAIREFHLSHSDYFQERFSGFGIFQQVACNGVFMANGERWKILRKFFIKKFGERGLNTIRDEMAGPMYDSLNATIEDINALKGKSVNLLEVLGQRCAVLMRKVIFGQTGITDEELQSMSINYSDSMEGMLGVNSLLMGPFARFLFSLNPKLRRSLQKHRAFRGLLLSCVKKIERSMDEKCPTCIIEDFYKEKNERRRNNDPTWKIFTDNAIVDSVLQFVGDGITGVAAFISGFLNVLIKHPEEQEKLYDELMEVIGPNRQPSLEDKVNLPYFNAFINEVLRENSFLPIFPSLKCTKETTIRGYIIPKGSITVLNFVSANLDPDTFEAPDTFNPSRFMPTPNKPKAERPATFGIGKRSCSGEMFVMSQTFLFLTTIVKNFKIVSSNDSSNVSADFLITGKLELSFHPRSES